MQNRIRGFYSLGLVGYEVEILDDEHVSWLYVGTQQEQVRHTARIRYTSKGRAYFLVTEPRRRIHLDECLRAGT